MSSRLRLGSLVALVAALVASCDTGTSTMSMTTSNGPDVAVLDTASPTSALLRKLERAPYAVAYSGVRKIEQHWAVGPDAHSLEYREKVWADGQGHFAITEPELIQPPMSPAEEQIWGVLQEGRQGFLYRYRDFHVRDTAAFARNYSLALLGTNVQVAGRTCDEMVLQRRRGAQILYTLAVDTETGLVLRCRQELINGGALFELSEFESIDFDPDLSSVVWHEADIEEERLLDSQAQQQLEFQPKLPKSDGGAFTLLSTSMLTVREPSPAGSEIRWAKYTLTDGVEVVFFLHGGSDRRAQPGDDVVRVPPSIGPWNVLEGTLHRQRVMALGRVSTPDLLDLLAAQF